VAEHLRVQIEGLESQFQNKLIKVTISLGISSFEPGDSPSSLLSRADEALYQAKRNGRNCFVRL